MLRSVGGAREVWRGVSIGLVAAGLAAAGWLTTDALEANNDFCTSCHLPSGARLHAEIRRGFDARPAQDLAGVHGRSLHDAGSGPRAFRCVDCHGGVGWGGRVRVKALAARDAMVWLAGAFDEPDHMKYPLGEADCGQCHRGFDPEQGIDAVALRFHGLAVHNADLGVKCVECHAVHEGGGDASIFYMEAAHVREQCERCHSEFGKG